MANRATMSERKRVSLKVIDAPAPGAVLTAPPPLIASAHTVEYTCGYCGVVLMHAEEQQVHELTIRCVSCGSYNVCKDKMMKVKTALVVQPGSVSGGVKFPGGCGAKIAPCGQWRSGQRRGARFFPGKMKST